MFASHRLKQVYTIDRAVIKMSESREAVLARYLAQYPNTSPILNACASGNLDDVKVLLTVDNINNLGSSAESYGTPLMIAAENEHFQIVEYLIAKGADPTIANSGGWNALHFAAGSGTNTELTQLLLTHMTLDSINKMSSRGFTPLDYAYEYNRSPLRQEIIALIRSAGGKANWHDENGRLVGEGNGDLNTTDNNNNNNNSKRPRKESNDGGSNKKMKQMNLLEAAKEGRTEVVKDLLEKGAEVNQESNNGQTPLHKAAYYGHTEIAKLLLAAGAEVNQESNNGQTPLHKAAKRGHTEICKLLLDNRADPTATDEDGNSVLWHAFNSGKDDIVKLLVDNMDKDQVNKAASDGETPLHLAVQDGSIDIVKLLIEKGAEVNAQDNSNRAALFFALSEEYYDSPNIEIVKLLLDAGADKNQLPLEELKQLQLLTSQEMIPKEREVVATCPICLDPLGTKEKGPAIRTACGHIFHRECLRQAIIVQVNLGQPTVCPTCRERIVIGVDDMGEAVGITFRLCAMSLKF